MQMPVMDGYTATRQIRQIEAEQNSEKIPIIALTAHALNDEINKSMDAGCVQHISKPIRKQHLVEILINFAPPTAFTKTILSMEI